jgi:excisionase family DNA binding protein
MVNEMRQVSREEQEVTMERMLTRRELAERLSVTVRTVERMMARGDLRIHRVGADARFLWSEVIEDTREKPVSLAQALRRV